MKIIALWYWNQPNLASVSTLQRDGWLSSSGSCQGKFSISCHQRAVWCLKLSAYSRISYDLFSRAGPGSGKIFLEPKTGSIPFQPGSKGQEGIRGSDTSVYVPIMSVVFTMARHFLWHRSRGNDYLQEVIFPSTHPKMEKLLDFH